jgi:hypothetical protein
MECGEAADVVIATVCTYMEGTKYFVPLLFRFPLLFEMEIADEEMHCSC